METGCLFERGGFFNLEKTMVQCGNAQVQEVGSHAAEDQKQIRTSSWYNKPSRISPRDVLQS